MQSLRKELNKAWQDRYQADKAKKTAKSEMMGAMRQYQALLEENKELKQENEHLTKTAELL